MLLLGLAIAPGIAIIWYIYAKDKYDREPLKHLIISFLLGVVSTLPALALQLPLQWQLDGYFKGDNSVAYYAVFAFGLVAFSEEFSKYLMVRLYAYRKHEFNEPFDGIIYSVMVAMGFATLENILYVQQHGFATAIVRMFLSVPAHGAFGVLMGYYMGLARFNREKSRTLLLKGLLLAIFFHGTFDFCIFLQQSKEVTAYISEGLLMLAGVVIIYIAIALSRRAIHLHQEISRINYERRQQEMNI